MENVESNLCHWKLYCIRNSWPCHIHITTVLLKRRHQLTQAQVLFWGSSAWTWHWQRRCSQPWCPLSDQQRVSLEAWKPSLWQGLLWVQKADSSPSWFSIAGAFHPPQYLSWCVEIETHRACCSSCACGLPSSRSGCWQVSGSWYPPRRSADPQLPSSPPSPWLH